MTEPLALFSLTAKLRRDQPLNPHTRDLCDRAERQAHEIAERDRKIEELAREIAALRSGRNGHAVTSQAPRGSDVTPPVTSQAPCPECERRRTASAERMRRFRARAAGQREEARP
jgi:hypothetical protein